MKLRHAAQLLSLAAVVAACGSEATVEQPDDCEHALERVEEAPFPADVRVGDAWFSGLRTTQELPWDRHWIAEQGYAFFKVAILVPAGGTLQVSVPPEARGLLRLQYEHHDGETATDEATVSACYGQYAVVPFYGGLRLKRPLCRVPLDWRYGDQRGRLHLTFGDACG